MGNGKISVILGTLNEEDQIRDCLDSVKDIADEIIITDSVSDDRTVEICREYTNKIFIRPYERYARTKNWMLQFVSNEWVLSVDADERFTPELIQEIRARLRKDRDLGINGYWFPFKYICFGQSMNYWKNGEEHLRLFQKGKGFWEDKEVHSKLMVQGKTGKFKNSISHLPYRNLENVRDKLSRYPLWDAEERFKHKKYFKWYNPFITVLKPLFKFLQSYVRNRGFKDGFPGFKICFFMSFYTFLVDIHHYTLVIKNNLQTH